jgi:hypothetical protein
MGIAVFNIGWMDRCERGLTAPAAVKLSAKNAAISRHEPVRLAKRGEILVVACEDLLKSCSGITLFREEFAHNKHTSTFSGMDTAECLV